jgi:hypothetical protein
VGFDVNEAEGDADVETGAEEGALWPAHNAAQNSVEPTAIAAKRRKI